MKILQDKLFRRFSIGDISFFMLRLATILGGIIWLSLAPLSPVEAAKLVKALLAFSAYSILIYLFILSRIARPGTIYVISLVLDLLFVFTLVNLQPISPTVSSWAIICSPLCTPFISALVSVCLSPSFPVFFII